MKQRIKKKTINETNHNEQTPDQFFFYFAQPIKKDEQNINNQKNFFLPANATSHNVEFLEFFSNISIHFVFFVLTPSLCLSRFNRVDYITLTHTHTDTPFMAIFSVCSFLCERKFFAIERHFFNIRRLNVQRMNPFRKLLRKPVYNEKKRKRK